MLLKVKVKANSYINKLLKKEGDSLVISVKAPREKGLANKHLINTLSEAFSIPKEAITIQSGEFSLKKLIVIDDSYANLVFEKLSSLSTF